MQLIVPTIALLSVASAAPTLTSRATSTTFNLVYKSVGNAPESVDALNSGIWYVGNKNSQLVLSSSENEASLFYGYGNSDPRIATAAVGINITSGGTATVPDGKPIKLVANNGTAPMTAMLNASGLPTLWYGGGRFMACAGEAGEIFLSYVADGQRFLTACAAVELQSICSKTGTGSEMVGQLGKPINVGCTNLNAHSCTS